MYDLRRSAGKLADAKQSPAAKAALKALNQDIEDLNVAARRKQVRGWGEASSWGLGVLDRRRRRARSTRPTPCIPTPIQS